MSELIPVNINKKKHESKPIRAGVAGLLTGIVEAPLFLGQIAETVATLPFNALRDKGLKETWEDSSIGKMRDTTEDVIHNVIGANQPENQDQNERRARFAGELVPIIASGGTKGLLKAPKAITNALTKGARKKAQQAFRTVATNNMNKFTDKSKRLSVLYESNKGYSSPELRKFLNDSNVSQFNSKNSQFFAPFGEARQAALKVGDKGSFLKEMLLLPGVQVQKTSQLLPKHLKFGVHTPDEISKALKAVRTEQALQLAGQTVAPLAIYEALAAYNNAEGLVGDYSDSLDQTMNKQESDWLTPLAILGLSAFGMHYGGKKLQQMYGTEYEQLMHAHKTRITEKRLRNINFENLPADQQTTNSLSTNFYNNTAFLDDPRFSYMFNDLDKANMRYDTTTSINSILQTGYPNIAKDNIKPMEIYNNLADLHTHHPEEWKKLEDYLDTNNKIASYINNHNISTQGELNFKKYTYMDDTNLPIVLRNDEVLQQLRQNSRTLRKELEANPVLKKILQDISRDSDIRLDLAVKSGRIPKVEADYLRKNYTVDGYYSYKPFMAQKPDKSIAQIIKNTALSQEFLDDVPLYGRVLRNLDQEAMSYTDTYLGSVMRDLEYAQKNSRIKAMINGMDQQYITLEQINKEVGNVKESLNAIIEKIKDPSTDEIDLLQLERSKDKLTGLKKQLEQKALNLTHIEYMGYIKPFTRGEIKLSTTPYNWFNQQKYKPLQNINTFASTHRKHDDIVKEIQNYKSSNNMVMFTDDQGISHYFRVNPLLKRAIDMSPDLPNAFGLAMLRLKRIKQEFTTGAYNPLFAVTSAVYGLQETMTALPRILAKPAKFSDYMDTIKYNYQAFRLQLARNLKQSIVNDWKSEWIRTFGDMTQSSMSAKYTDAMIRKMELDIENCLMTKFERAGAVAYRYPEGMKNTQYPLSMDSSYTQKMKRELHNVWGAKKAIKCAQFVDYCTDALRNSSTIGAMLQLNAKNKFQNMTDMRMAVEQVSKYITDTKKSGIHVGIIGNILGFIGKYIPYGRVCINSIGAKLESLHAGDGIEFLKAAKNRIAGSKNTWAEVAHMTKLGATGLLGNQYLQSLYFTALIPTTAAYLWNHLSTENKQDYYTFSDYNKSSRLMLTNFYGKGKHLVIPMDQEIGVACKLYETMLDSVLNLSKDNGTDPAFQQSRVLGMAIARSLNLEDMVVPEVLLNSAGLTTNFDIGSGQDMISPLPMNQTNLDGSQTALQNGIMSQEAHAIINTMFGAVGKSLANGAEQFNIGARDVSITQGVKDFLTRSGEIDTSAIPFLPTSKVSVKGTTQTAQLVKNKIETIDKLRKLNTFNATDATMVGKSGAKVKANIMQPTLDPKLQFASQVAQVAVPYYNQKIKPIYDKISGIYKQIAAYNATGRDQFGKIVDAMDRWKYQQNKTKEVQQIYKQLYFEFEKLENILTNQFNRDIVLLEFNSLQGV